MARLFLFVSMLFIAIQVAFSNRSAAVIIILAALYLLTRKRITRR